MPTSKELTIRIENRPGTLAKVCRSLADQRVNILAFQSVPMEGTPAVRMVVDNPTAAKKALETEHISYTETEVAHARIRPDWTGNMVCAACHQWALRPALHLRDLWNGALVHPDGDRPVLAEMEASGYSEALPVHGLPLATGDLCFDRRCVDA